MCSRGWGHHNQREAAQAAVAVSPALRLGATVLLDLAVEIADTLAEAYLAEAGLGVEGAVFAH